MLPDRVSNPGTLTYESGALPIALRGPAISDKVVRSSSDSKVIQGSYHLNFRNKNTG